MALSLSSYSASGGNRLGLHETGGNQKKERAVRGKRLVFGVLVGGLGWWVVGVVVVVWCCVVGGGVCWGWWVGWVCGL